MGHGRIWQRGERGFYAWVEGKQVRLGHDREAAQKEYHRLKSLSEPILVARATTGELVDLYLESAKTRVAPITYDRYRYACQQWVNSYGTMLASELRPYHLSRWLEKHPRWNASTKSLEGSIVKLWASWSHREGYLPVNYLRAARVPSIARRKPADPADLEKLFAVATGPFKDFLTVLWDTGARPGEIRSLEASQIDWEHSTARVSGKTGIRVIGLSKRAMVVLRNHVANELTILINGNGLPWSKAALRYAFNKTCKESGLVHLTPYALRHDFWRRAVLAGVDSVLIAKQLGHRNLTQLISRYAHPDASQLALVSEQAASHSQMEEAKPVARKTQPRLARRKRGI